MQKQMTKGNEAIVKSAILAGCRAFYGYPITPASEIAEAAALYMPQAGGVFLQAESEVAAVNMLYGAAATGVRAMSASSGPGISLMQEGISYIAGAELPCVVADIMRGGPGLGNIAPEQGDYHQVVKGGGHGCYRTIVLAPNSVQEMADLTARSFRPGRPLPQSRLRAGRRLHRADDGAGGISRSAGAPRTPEWAVAGNSANPRQPDQFHSSWNPTNSRPTFSQLEAKYKRAEREAVQFEDWRTEDAEIVLVGYGIVSRILKAGGGNGPRARHRRRSAAPDHFVSVPRRAPPPAQPNGPPIHGGGTEHRADDRRRTALARRPPPGGVLRPAWEATCPAPKRYCKPWKPIWRWKLMSSYAITHERRKPSTPSTNAKPSSSTRPTTAPAAGTAWSTN